MHNKVGFNHLQVVCYWQQNWVSQVFVKQVFWTTLNPITQLSRCCRKVPCFIWNCPYILFKWFARCHYAKRRRQSSRLEEQLRRAPSIFFFKRPFVLIRSHNTLCIFNTALTKPKIWLHSHDSYLKFGIFGLWSEWHLLHVFGVSTFYSADISPIDQIIE